MKLFKKKQIDLPRRRMPGYDASVPAQTDIFKRNRTLTGTTSNNLRSVNSGSDLESQRTHVHHLTIKRRKISSIMFVVFISIMLLYAIVSNFTATASVGFSDLAISKTIDKSKYEKVIQDYLDANPLGRFHVLLDQKNLTDYVSNKMPEVEKVTQNYMVNLGVTGFSIDVRTPIAGWKMGSKQYYVDSRGIPFENNYFLDPVVQIVDNSGVSMQSGTAIASKRFLSFVGRVVFMAKTKGYTVTQAILPANTTRELEVRIKEGNYLVKLSIDRVVGEQIEDMSNAIQFFVGRNQVPEYIDVRVSGKAFYK